MTRHTYTIHLGVLTTLVALGLATTGSEPALGDVDDQLVAHWTFNEGSGIIAHDSSGHFNHATIIGVPEWVEDGVVGSALHFSGADSYARCPDSASLRFASSTDFTIAAWIRLDSPTGMRILYKGYGGEGAGGRYYSFGVRHDPLALYTNVNDGSAPQTEFSGATTLGTGTWYHVALTVYRDGLNVFYVNGAPDATNSVHQGNIDYGNPLYIGRRQSTPLMYFHGTIDELRIYNRALSAEELSDLAWAKGACCNPATGICNDDVEALGCPPSFQFTPNALCAALEPPCGNPGCCCDDATGQLTQEFEVNCADRFTAGVGCDPDPFDPPCGEYVPCEHSITMWDDYGDGWNGGTLDVLLDGALVLDDITLGSGYGPATFVFAAGTGAEITTVFNPGGWPHECSYCLYDGEGAQLGCDGTGGTTPTGVTVTGHCPPPANLPPMCTIVAPAPGQEVNGVIVIKGDAADPDGSIGSVEVRVDGGGWESVDGWFEPHWGHTWDTSLFANGSHTLYVRSIDNEGLSSPVVSIGVCTSNPTLNRFFIHLTDTHIAHSGASGFSGAKENLQKVLEYLRTRYASPKPAFVLITGDIADFPWAGHCSDAYEEFKSCFFADSNGVLHLDSSLSVPVCIVSGNHDYYALGHGIVCYVSALQYALSYAFIYDDAFDDTLLFGLRTLADEPFEACDWPLWWGGMPEAGAFSLEEIDAISMALSDPAAIQAVHKFLFMHHPAIYCDEDCWGEGCIAHNRPEFISLCTQKDVSLVLTGHTHGGSVYAPSCEPGQCSGVPLGACLQDPNCEWADYEWTVRSPRPGDDGYPGRKSEWYALFGPGEGCLHETGYIITPSTVDSCAFRRIVWGGNGSTAQYKVYSATAGANLATFSQQTTPPAGGARGGGEQVEQVASLHVYDSLGHHMADDGQGGIQNEIDGGAFRYLWLPMIEGATDAVRIGSTGTVPWNIDAYVVELHGIGEGLVSLRCKYSQKDGSWVELLFGEVTVVPGSVGRIDVPPGGYGITLLMDEDGDGTVDRELEPEEVRNQLTPYRPSIPSGPNCGCAQVAYVYSAHSLDPEGDELYYKFDWDDGSESEWVGPYASGEAVEAPHAWDEDGAYQVKTCAQDEYGYVSAWSPALTVVIGDMIAPTVDCSVTTDVLWAPEHQLAEVGLTTSVSDNCDPVVGESLIMEVWSDETEVPDTGDGTGRHCPDAKDIDTGLRLRNERRATEDGRVYLIIARAEDASGNVGFGYCTVVVPHDQSQEGLDEVAGQAAAALATVEATPGETIAEKMASLISQGWTQHGLSEELGPHQ